MLAALPAAERDRVLRAVESVHLTLKQVIQKADERVSYVFFPAGGFLSVVTVLEDGCMVEVATVGREGAVGMSGALNGSSAEGAIIVQGQWDVCYRMSAVDFRAEMDRGGAFYKVMMRYSQAFVALIMQSAACNAVHSVEQRLARWLLMAQDRMESSEFTLTQEFVAMMLGANRSTVTLVAGTLQRAGLISYHRGRLTVLHRKKLEDASCECYRMARKALAGLSLADARRPRPRS